MKKILTLIVIVALAIYLFTVLGGSRRIASMNDDTPYFESGGSQEIGILETEEVREGESKEGVGEGFESASAMPVDDTLPIAWQYRVDGEKLKDVTDGNASGFVRARYDTEKGMYQMEGVFENLPTPEGEDFYEGWIVRRGSDQSVISTGALEMEEVGTYSDSYTSDKDLTDHDFYVLTIEPNDGDPAPADHILEGVLVKI